MTGIAKSANPQAVSQKFGTVVSGDFEGSERLFRTAAPERMTELARRLYAMLSYYVRQYRGVMMQPQEDGTFLATFDAVDGEGSDDCHAARALGASIAIRRAFSGDVLTARIAAHAGDVRDPATVSIAKSMREAAAGNEIRVSDRVVQLTQQQFEFEIREQQSVPGLGEVKTSELVLVAKNHATKLNSYLYRPTHDTDKAQDTDHFRDSVSEEALARNFPVLRDIL